MYSIYHEFAERRGADGSDGSDKPVRPRMTRREWMRVGGLSVLGLSSADLAGLRALAAEDATSTARRGNSCVFIFLFGGPSHIDLWDMKPDAPSHVRGEFQPVATETPGILLSDQLPHLARQTDKLCLLRSMTHDDPVHGTACSQMITGRPHRRPGTTDTFAADDWPSLSSMVMRYGRSHGGMPASIVLPWYLMFPSQGRRIAGQTGALMGERHNAFLVEGDPSEPDFAVPGVKLPHDVPVDRLLGRRDLLRQVEALNRGVLETSQSNLVGSNYQTAFSMLGGTGSAAAFDIQAESRQTRDRYGDQKFSQSLLLARRLVERGTSLVTVNWDDDTRSEKQSPFWDTHHDNFGRLKRLTPTFDQSFSAFLQDLGERGLLDSTLVVVMGEFGRSPKIGRIVQNGMTAKTGRDHWPYAFTVLLAGGGVRGGQVYGATDKLGGYVKDSAVSPADLNATILHHLGIDGATLYRASLLGETHRLSIGQPITDLG